MGDDDNLPEIRRGEVGEPIDYVEVFAEDVPPQVPWYTKGQVFLIGICLGFLIAVAAFFYLVRLPGVGRPIPPEGIPVRAVDGSIARAHEAPAEALSAKVAKR